MKKRLFPLCAALALMLTACTPKPAPSPTLAYTPTPPPEQAASVYTDWSKLGDKPQPLQQIGSRWYEGYTDTLLPQDDYGMLVPYAGLRLMDDWPANTGCLYGLMTTDGVAVTDAVFSSVYPLHYYDNGRSCKMPVLTLSGGNEEGQLRIALAAMDGSWATEPKYCGIGAAEEGALLFTRDGIELMNREGAFLEAYSVQDLSMTQGEFDEMLSAVFWGEGVSGEWRGDYISLMWAEEAANSVALYQRSTGQRVVMSTDAWYAYKPETSPIPGYLQTRFAVSGGKTTLHHQGAPYVFPLEDEYGELYGKTVLFPNSGAMYTLTGEELLPPGEDKSIYALPDRLLGDDAPGLVVLTVREGDTHKTFCYTMDGQPITWLDNWEDGTGRYWYRSLNVVGGLIEVVDLNVASYYDIDTRECVFRTYLGFEGD